MQLSKSFCRCVKKVRRTIKTVRGKRNPSAAEKESAAIAICVRSVLGRRGKTLKKFSCGRKGNKAFLKTQKML